EVYPSWWNKTQGQTNATLDFDRVSKKKATDCTPAAARINLPVIKVTDPVTKKDNYSNVPEGYNANEEDDAHNCSTDVKPSISSVSYNSSNGEITVTVSEGSPFKLTNSSVVITVNGATLTVTKQGPTTYRAT